MATHPSCAGRDLAFGHRRLSIIDLSPLGNQPMAYRSLTVTYNGELYNYIELREELKQLGHRFSSQSDTEVLLHSWAEWGPECLSRLNGIFAFLLWDADRRTLFAARDRLGVKPLYYRLDAGEMAFASEIKAILAVAHERPVVDEALVFDFLATGRLDHEEGTMFLGVRRLPGGCWMEVSREGHQVRRYWTPADARRAEERVFIRGGGQALRGTLLRCGTTADAFRRSCWSLSQRRARLVVGRVRCRAAEYRPDVGIHHKVRRPLDG